MIATLAIAGAAIVLLLGVLSAWQSRRRKAAAEAARLSSGWQLLINPRGSMHASTSDLIVLNLGYNRIVSAAFASNVAGREQACVEVEFDSGFGENRRHYCFVVLTVELPNGPRAMLISRDPILAAAAIRPGFVTRRDGEWRWIADDPRELDLMVGCVADWLPSIPAEQSVEFRPGTVAVFQPGDLTDASQTTLVAAVESLLPRLENFRK